MLSEGTSIIDLKKIASYILNSITLETLSANLYLIPPPPAWTFSKCLAAEEIIIWTGKIKSVRTDML